MGVYVRSPAMPPRPAEAVDFPSKATPYVNKRTIEVDLKPRDEVTPEDIRDWMDVQIPYPNLASDKRVYDKARHYTRQQIRYYVDRTWEIRDKWRALDSLLRGSTLSRRFMTTDIHVPELYKMVETLVPRIEEAVFGQGPNQPWFNVLGRDAMDKRRAYKIRAWLEYLLEEAKFDENLVQQAARCMVVYGFFAIKSWWDIQFKRVIKRETENLDSVAGIPRYKLTTEEVKKLVKYAPRYELIDPYDFLIDTRVTDHQKGLFVGDIGLFTYEELMAQQELGYFTNVEKVLEQDSLYNEATDRRWAKFERSLTGQTGIYDERRARGEPDRYEVSEIWGLFDPNGDGHAEEYAITVANQDIVLRVQRNPHDDRHRPYAVGRAAREPFDFHNVGVLDHGIRVNIEIDEHRNLALKGHENSLCPLVFTPDSQELPPNIFDVEPGEVFRTQSPPTFFQSPPVFHIMQGMDQTTRRDLEEITGAPRIYEGQTQAGETATGIERKIEEGNRRLRSLIRSFSTGMRQLLDHTYAMSAQYTTRRETFQVMGRDALVLGEHSDIGPQELATPVDFKITGLSSIHTLGLRATNMATFFNQIYPIAANFTDPTEIDWMRMLQLSWDYMVGTVPGEQIFKSDENADLAVDPEIENLMMTQESQIQPVLADDDQYHEQQHRRFREENKLSEYAEQLLLAHEAMHRMQRQQKRLREQQRQRQIQRMQEMQQSAEPTQALGGKGRGAGREPDLGTGPGQTPPGELPGPPRAEGLGAPDRDMPVAQTQNGASAV